MGEYEDRLWKELDDLGETEVRLQYGRGTIYTAPQAKAAVEEWLRRQEESRSDASKQEDRDLAIAANRHAKNANRIAIAALIVAIISIIIAWASHS